MAMKAGHDSAAGATEEIPGSRARELWLVRGKWYDLARFQHPGGAWWIEETQGQDIRYTVLLCLVRIHHPPKS